MNLDGLGAKPPQEGSSAAASDAAARDAARDAAASAPATGDAATPPATGAAATPPASRDAATPPGSRDAATPPASGDAATPPGQRIAELECELEEARARARHERDLLFTMSHELRTPLNGVMGMAHLLLESELDREQRSMVEVIRQSCRALVLLVNDTLDFARIESGHVTLEHIDFDLRVTVSEIAALLAPLAHDKHLDLDCRVQHEVPARLTGDPGRIRQVLLNLIGNAIKFTNQGRVVIGVERSAEDDTHVTVRFVVTDTGIGMDDAQRQRVFEDFEQGDASIARRFGGTGLGLSVSRKIVELMGGTIGVDSTPGKGSTFWFALPIEKQTEAPAPPPGGEALAQVKVLVADPSRASRAALNERLTAWGCAVVEAETGTEALDRLREAASHGAPCRIALLDRYVEGGGDALGAAIRDEASLAAARTVLMASDGQRGDGAEARARGFAAYLTKPLDWETLAEALAEVLRQPDAPAKPPELVTRHTVAEARRSRVKILLVEDNVVNQLVTGWTLQRLGYTVQTANGGANAIEQCQKETFALIVTDIQMPDMDGYAFTRALHATQHARGITLTPVLALTGSAEFDERERCLKAGMTDCMEKPVDLARLCERVQQLTADPTPGEAPATESAPAPAATAAPAATLVPAPASAPTPGAAPAGPAPVANASTAAGGDGPPLDSARLAEMSMGVPSMRDKLLDTFLNEVHPRMEALRVAMFGADMEACEFEAHGLKGMCATVGALRCAELFDAIERGAKEGTVSALAPLYERAAEMVEQAERYINGTDRTLLAA
ncbi:MAG TPA: response regulator [Candidatus Eisenbacteria bacterium]|nr:response regulator [Candidatus Eisenbacteria bacterium]